MIHNESKIYIAGHNGLVGSAVLKLLRRKNFNNLVFSTRKELDLRDRDQTFDFFDCHKPEYVVDAAAKVGGINANDSLSGEFIRDNLLIQQNLIESSRIHRIKKFIFLGSVCIYPKFASLPITENSLMTGDLEPTNEAYAIAKIAGIYMLKAYEKQYGFLSASLMPCNIYGPNDNFDPNLGHVIPSLMYKMKNFSDQITLWGDGSPYREFMHADDLAEAILLSLSEPKLVGMINVGTGENISILELSKIMASITNYQGIISWDKSKPNGTPNRPLNSQFIRSLGWMPRISLQDGLLQTWREFTTNNYQNRTEFNT